MLDRRAFLLTSAAATAAAAVPRPRRAADRPFARARRAVRCLLSGGPAPAPRKRDPARPRYRPQRRPADQAERRIARRARRRPGADLRSVAPPRARRSHPPRPRRPARLRRRHLHPRGDGGGSGVRFRRRRLRPVAVRRQPADRRVPVGPRLPRHQASDCHRCRRRRLPVACGGIRHSSSTIRLAG